MGNKKSNIANYVKRRLSNLSHEKTNLITTLTEAEDELKEIDSKLEKSVSLQCDINQYHEELFIKKKTVLNKIDSLKSELIHIEMEERDLKQCIDEAKSFNENAKEQLENFDENYGLRILEKQENERQRIARELHDSTVQVLTNLVHKTELCMRIMDVDPIRTKLELEIINNNIRYTINDMRNIIHNLRPMSLDDFGWDTTLERIISQIRNNVDDIELHLKITGDKCNVSPVIALTLVRIIQEACNNSIKHAKAKNIYVDFSYMKNKLCLVIQDDGVGFKPDKFMINNDNTGFGISIMKERAMLLSGELKIKSEKNKGTSLSIVVPI